MWEREQYLTKSKRSLYKEYFQACHDGELEKIEFLLTKLPEKNLDMNFIQGFAMQKAFESGNIKTIQFLESSPLLKQHISLARLKKKWMPTLIQGNDTDIFDYVIKKSHGQFIADPQNYQKTVEYALQCASERKNSKMFQCVLDIGKKLNIDLDLNIAFINACSSGSSLIIDCILNDNSRKISSDSFEIGFGHACKWNYLDIVKKLMSHERFKSENMGPLHGGNALNRAMYTHFCDDNVIEYLLDNPHYSIPIDEIEIDTLKQKLDNNENIKTLHMLFEKILVNDDLTDKYKDLMVYPLFKQLHDSMLIKRNLENDLDDKKPKSKIKI